jgi:hypothetical protein
MNIVTVLCAVSAMPTLTGMPELAMSVADRWPMPCVPTGGTPARSRMRRQAWQYEFPVSGCLRLKIDGQT